MGNAAKFIIPVAVLAAVGGIYTLNSGKINEEIENANVSASISESTQSSASTAKTTKKPANPIVKAAVETVIDSYADSAEGETKEVLDSMSEEDKDTVTEIIASNVSLDTIGDLKGLASKGDTDAIMTYAEENLTEEEIAQLQDIMSKYAPQ